jgi:anti-sigma regulatory factor (Ser/Thr protein kinase)
MATVEIRFSALPAHVRTARLVAAAAARRAGVDEQLLDEIRLAVGEACSRAVGLHRRGGLNAPVTVTMGGEGERFVVAVRDNLGDPAGLAAAPEPDGWDDVMLGLAVLRGLVEDLEVNQLADGAEVRMGWPAPNHT